MDKRLALMCGIDIPVPECQLVVHQPRIKEIAYLGEQDFFIGAQTFCVSKTMFTQDKNILEQTNNFQIFMTIMSEKETADKKEAVKQIIPLFFPQYKMLLTPRSIVLQALEGDQVITIDESNFEILQNAISDICCLRSGSSDTFNPADAKAKEIADKLMRGRQRVAAQRSDGGNSSIFTQYLSILTIGINSMSLHDLMDLTIFQMYDLIERYSLFVNWDMDIRSRLAGGTPDSKPDNWMKNIH